MARDDSTLSASPLAEDCPETRPGLASVRVFVFFCFFSMVNKGREPEGHVYMRNLKRGQGFCGHVDAWPALRLRPALARIRDDCRLSSTFRISWIIHELREVSIARKLNMTTLSQSGSFSGPILLDGLWDLKREFVQTAIAGGAVCVAWRS